MYLEHFGLKEAPFSLTPDTSFYYNNAVHQEALNVLMVALRSGEGFIKISGEVGTGKTLLCRKLLNMLAEEERFVTAYIPNPYLTPVALNVAVADELGVEHNRSMGQHRVLKAINERLIELNGEGKQIVLCLDEAQAMPEITLEALRLLSNLETEKHKLLQIVLFGQPELDVLLAKPSVRQLKQRIVFSYDLEPLDRPALAAYLNYRLQVAGYNGDPLFAGGVLSLLHRASRGVPRLVNILAHKAMMLAYGRGTRTIHKADLLAAAHDTEDVVLRGGLRVCLYTLLGMGAVAATGWVLMSFVRA